jgi:hypothetical protein
MEAGATRRRQERKREREREYQIRPWALEGREASEQAKRVR